ncbi:hypothetical protein K1T71_005760 [Dendrolimus kikuchii]|uniref:Uncharacterized protein n=1 Tax=Dendrolimus kikuchii TaxID=765133 RepID=A0ACC1D5B1_9NEOP|nr:hypothetical protein K1T71_005760 [Dendrolimus kikuchii]
MICAQRQLAATLSSDWTYSHDYESLCIMLPARALRSTVNLHIILVYIPPDSRDLPVRLDHFRECITQYTYLYPTDHFVIAGDFNLPFIKWNNNTYSPLLHASCSALSESSTAFLDFLSYTGFYQYNFIKNQAYNTLDLCFSNLPLNIANCDNPVIKEDLYHPALIVRVLDLGIHLLKECNHSRFNFYKCDYNAINSYLFKINWNDLLLGKSTDDAVDAFYDKLHECILLHVPISVVKPNSKYPVWYSTALIKIIREKSKLHSRWKRFGNPRDYYEYSMLRDRQTHIIKKCYNNFINSSSKLIQHSPKYFWKYVKSKRGGSNYPNKFNLGKENFSDGQSICSAFNRFFKSVFIHPTSPISNITPRTQGRNTNNHNFESISNLNVNEELVLQLLKALDKNKGPGADGIPPMFLMSCAKSLSVPISILFRLSLKECVFPTLWKKAQIIPIHKKGSRSSIDNYRPISILSTIAKLFEKIIYTYIYPIIARNIPDTQHGFYKGRSTTSNLAIFSDYIHNNMENGGQVDVIYTDFEKAFDRVDHFILLHKLEYLGIQGDLLRWVESYLTNRSQIVVMGGFRSDCAWIPSGVPQGSHLGPLFYNAYIFDINHCFDSSLHLLYADDKKIYMRVNNFDDCNRIQKDLNTLYEYYTVNRINVNVKKCQTITFTRRKNPVLYPYHFNGCEIDRTDVVRDLGVYFDSKMVMAHHINTITNKAFRNLGFIMRICKPFTSLLCMKVVYFAYVRSILEYCSPIWNPHYRIYSNRIEGIQKKFLRHLDYKLQGRHSTYEQRCLAYRLLNMEQRRVFLDMGLLYDIMHSRSYCPAITQRISYCAPMRRTRHTIATYCMP